jgi:hypothetical protein
MLRRCLSRIGPCKEVAVEREKARAYNPLETPDPHQARLDLENQVFALGRLQTLRPVLLEKYQRTVENEKVTDWYRRYRDLLPRRDALATEFSDILVRFAAIGDLFARMKALDREMDAVNFARPAAVPEFLTSVECYTRGIDRFDTTNKSIIEDTRLPYGNGTDIYPPRQVIDPMLFGGTIRDTHAGKDWALIQQKREEEFRDQQRKQIAKQEADAVERQLERNSPAWWAPNGGGPKH